MTAGMKPGNSTTRKKTWTKYPTGELNCLSWASKYHPGKTSAAAITIAIHQFFCFAVIPKRLYAEGS